MFLKDFRKKCGKYCSNDLCGYISTLGLSLDEISKMLSVKLKYVLDIDTFKKKAKGGISYIAYTELLIPVKRKLYGQEISL